MLMRKFLYRVRFSSAIDFLILSLSLAVFPADCLSLLELHSSLVSSYPVWIGLRDIASLSSSCNVYWSAIICCSSAWVFDFFWSVFFSLSNCCCFLISNSSSLVCLILVFARSFLSLFSAYSECLRWRVSNFSSSWAVNNTGCPSVGMRALGDGPWHVRMPALALVACAACA